MDREAAVALAEQWDAWACSIAVRLWQKFWRRMDREDLISAARLGLWKAALKYEVKAPFPGFARKGIECEVLDAIGFELAAGIGMTARERKKLHRQPVLFVSEIETPDGQPFDFWMDHRPDVSMTCQKCGGRWIPVRAVRAGKQSGKYCPTCRPCGGKKS